MKVFFMTTEGWLICECETKHGAYMSNYKEECLKYKMIKTGILEQNSVPFNKKKSIKGSWLLIEWKIEYYSEHKWMPELPGWISIPKTGRRVVQGDI